MQEEELYESISSEKWQSQNIQQVEKEHPTTEEEDNSQAIVFPPMPKEFPKILDIYRKNGEKMKALREEVSRLECDILAEQRLKYSASNFETCIDGIQQIDLDDFQIAEFDKKRKGREDKLLRLKKLYGYLNKLNKTEVVLKFEENQVKMIDKIRQTKEVVDYRVVGGHLIMVIKCKTSPQPQESLISSDTTQTVIQESTVVMSQGLNSEDYFSIGIFDLNKLHDWLSPKQVLLELGEDDNSERLEAYRKQAQMYATMVKKVSLKNIFNITTCTYSAKHKLVFTHEQTGKVSVFTAKNEPIDSVMLDSSDILQLFQPVDEELFVGTAEGIVRIYEFNIKGSLKLKRIFICCWETLVPVRAYRILSSQKIHFCVESSICEYDLRSNMISEIKTIEKMSQIQNKAVLIGLMAFECNDFPHLESERLTLIERMKKMKVKQSSIVHFFVNQTLEKGKKETSFKLLTGDREGDLEMLTI